MSSIFSGSLLPDGDSVQHQPDQEVSLREPEKVVGLVIRRHRRDRGPTLSPGKMNPFSLAVDPIDSGTVDYSICLSFTLESWYYSITFLYIGAWQGFCSDRPCST